MATIVQEKCTRWRQFQVCYSGLGCTIGGIYFGSFGYADDIILLTPSRESLQLMLDLCEKYAEEYSMLFSTDPDPIKSKTKCLHFTKNEREVKRVQFNGNDYFL